MTSCRAAWWERTWTRELKERRLRIECALSVSQLPKNLYITVGLADQAARSNYLRFAWVMLAPEVKSTSVRTFVGIDAAVCQFHRAV